jgi:hypothetical protein
MSGYRQPYNLPFNPSNAPLQGNARNDEFNAKRPAIVGAPNFIQVDPKWQTYDPGGVLTFAGVDPQREMLMLSTNGDKQICGLRIDLPVPTVVGESVSYALYTSVFFAQFEANVTAEQTTRMDAGIVLCEDIQANPDTSFMYLNGIALVTQTNTFAIAESVGIVENFIAFDDPGTGLAESAFGTPSAVRFRMRQTLVSPGVYSVTAYADQSNGVGWVPMTQSAGGNVLYRQMLLGIRSVGGIGVSALFDYFRFEVLEDVEQGDITTGYAQTLGAV